MNAHNNIYLVGFMACGKTSVSAAMEKLFGNTVVEIDDEIVAREGKSVNEIFAEKGEPYFRDLETEMLREIGEREQVVVSCGGGIVLREENIRLMKEHGYIVWLDAEPETILERVKDDDSRPNLRGRKTVEGIQELKSRREPAYRAAADMRIATDGKTIDEIARELNESVNRAG